MLKFRLTTYMDVVIVLVITCARSALVSGHRPPVNIVDLKSSTLPGARSTVSDEPALGHSHTGEDYTVERSSVVPPSVTSERRVTLTNADSSGIDLPDVVIINQLDGSRQVRRHTDTSQLPTVKAIMRSDDSGVAAEQKFVQNEATTNPPAAARPLSTYQIVLIALGAVAGTALAITCTCACCSRSARRGYTSIGSASPSCNCCHCCIFGEEV